MTRRRRRLAQTILVVGALLWVAVPGYAASPSGGSVGPSNSSTGWAGKSFTVGATASPAACTSVTCDTYSLNVAADSSYWDTHTGSVSVYISWGDSSDNFDLYVYRSGSLVGSSGSSSSSSEGVSFSDPYGTYTVQVVPKAVTGSGYSGSASFSSADKPVPSPSPTSKSGGSGIGGTVKKILGSGKSGKGGGSGSGSGQGGSTGSGGTSLGKGGTGRSGGIALPPPNQTAPVNVGQASGPIFNYTGPMYFAPPFMIAKPGAHLKLKLPKPPTGKISRGAPNNTTAAPANGTGSATRARATVTLQQTSGSSRVPPGFLWALIPLGLIVLAAIGAFVFEPAEEEMGEGIKALLAASPGLRSAAEAKAAQAPPPGPLVLLGFATRRVVGAAVRRVGRLVGRDR